MRRLLLLILLPLIACYSLPSNAQDKTINLTVGYKTVNYAAGLPTRAIAVNGSIPGPTLHFREGDNVNIYVHNHLNKPTSIHWHGLLVPWRMDGVSWVSQKPILPGKTFHYHFKIKQYGTYWYHAHKGLQEQRGLYGAIVIQPKQPVHEPAYNKDYVVVLSDWINTGADQVFDNLKKSGGYYENDFPMQTSLAQFIHVYRHANKAEKKKLRHTYWTMQKTGMGVYDIADIAYQKFLLNGHTPSKPWKRRVKVGDWVRLRIIDAGSSTYFHVKIPGAYLKVIGYEGNDVKPYTVKHLTLGPAETYDVLVHITQNRPYIIYAESASSLGKAIGALVTQPHQALCLKHIKPFPKPQPKAMRPIMPSTALMPKYRLMQATHPTNNPKQPVHVIHMKLSGYMDRYMWMINGKELAQAKPIPIIKGQRYRIIFTNMSLMHHPMHIHGHWFILRNGHGAYDPLIHTVDVAPFHTVIVDFKADASGQWFFHCHNLYHLDSGMARIFRYQSANKVKQHKEFADLNGPSPTWHYRTDLQALAALNTNNFQFTGQFVGGSDYNQLQLYMNQAEVSDGAIDNLDLDIFYMRTISQFWSLKGGMNYVNEPAITPYWQPGLGIEGTMPLGIVTDLRTYLHHGSEKFDLELSRDVWIYKALSLQFGVRTILATKTVADDMIGSGFNEIQLTAGPSFRLGNRLSLQFQYEYDRYFGARKTLRQNIGEPDNEDFFYTGLSLIL